MEIKIGGRVLAEVTLHRGILRTPHEFIKHALSSQSVTTEKTHATLREKYRFLEFGSRARTDNGIRQTPRAPVEIAGVHDRGGVVPLTAASTKPKLVKDVEFMVLAYLPVKDLTNYLLVDRVGNRLASARLNDSPNKEEVAKKQRSHCERKILEFAATCKSEVEFDQKLRALVGKTTNVGISVDDVVETIRARVLARQEGNAKARKFGKVPASRAPRLSEDEIVKNTLKTLSECTHLETLQFRANGLPQFRWEILSTLTAIDKNNPRLNRVELELQSCYLNAWNAETLAEIKALVHLDVSGNVWIENEGAQYLAAHPRLEYLRAVANNIGSVGAQALAKSKLRSLNIGSNKISNSGFAALAGSATLTTLYAAKNNVTTLSVPQWREQTKLKNLDVYGNYFSTDELRALTQVMSLSWLNIERSRITQDIIDRRRQAELNMGTPPMEFSLQR